MFAFSFTEKGRRRGRPNPLATLHMNILNSISCPIPSNVHYRSLSTFLSLTFVCMLQGGKDNFEGLAEDNFKSSMQIHESPVAVKSRLN